MRVVSRLRTQALGGNVSGNATSKGTDPAMPVMIALMISVKAVVTAGDSSLYTSFQFSSRKTFICFPATMVTIASQTSLFGFVWPASVQTRVRLVISNLCVTVRGFSGACLT